LDPKGGRVEDMDDMILRVRLVAATLKESQNTNAKLRDVARSVLEAAAHRRRTS
jgi:hypothetical protein